MFTILVVVLGLPAVYEFFRITGVSKNLPFTIFGIVFTLLFILYPHLGYANSLPIILTSGLILSLILLVFLPVKEGAFQHWAWMMAGILYVGWLLGLMVFLRLEAGRNWVFLALFTTFASDTAAYFIGKAFGKHKMAPKISPGKTWEGAIAGVFGAVILSMCFTLSTPLQLPFNCGQAIILGILISVFGQIGDLAESALKRSGGVKDSGNLMPGHGGMLDRMDSVIFAMAVIYLYYILIVL